MPEHRGKGRRFNSESLTTILFRKLDTMKNLTAIESLTSEFVARYEKHTNWFSVECVDLVGDLVCKPCNETDDINEALRIVESCKKCQFVEIRIVQWKRFQDETGVHLSDEKLIAKYRFTDKWKTIVSFPIQPSGLVTLSFTEERERIKETILSKRSGQHYRSYVPPSDDQVCEDILDKTGNIEHIDVLGYLCDLAKGERSKIVLQWAIPQKDSCNVEFVTREYDPIRSAIRKKHAEKLDYSGESIKQEAVSIFTEHYLRSVDKTPQIVKTVDRYINKDQPWLGKETIERTQQQPTNDKVCQILATMAVYEALSDSRRLDRSLEQTAEAKAGQEFSKYVTDHTYRETLAEIRKGLTEKQFRTLIALESGLTQRQAGEATGQHTSTINEHLKTIRAVARKIVQG